MNHLREFENTERDYTRLVEIHNAVHPEWARTVEGLKADDGMREKQYFHQRYVWEEDGEVVAYASAGESGWSYEAGKYFVSVVVHPGWQRRGIGSKLYEHIMGVLNAREPKPAKLMSDTREDLEDGVRFLKNRGYERIQRQEVSRLDVDSFDWERFAPSRGDCERAGLIVRTGDDLLANDPDSKAKLYDLVWSILQDVPMPDPLTRRPYEEWIKQFEHPAFLGESWFIALDGDEYVAMSSAWKDLASTDRFHQGLTGVLAPYRRKGVATDLKVRVNEFARDRGVRYIMTDNEENNPMYGINTQLGFERMPGWLIFRQMVGEKAPVTVDGGGSDNG
ncbi:GNAT family N-acetyltransferase [bacterium]|nr:GNAT family N-acetyltransferase [bacterium]